MGINGWELMVLLVVALLVIGPERLPEAAEQLGRVVRELRRVATGARERVREELGPEVADIDLAKLDPRQYDPRRIVREALTEDLDAAPQKASPSGPEHPASIVSRANGASGAAAAAAGGAAAGAARSGDGADEPDGEATVPYDDEAT